MRIQAAVLFLLMASLSTALTAEVSIGSVTVPLESTKSVTVSFFSDINDTLVLSILGEKPWMVLSDSKILIGKNETKNVTLYITPKSDTTVGLYKVNVVGESLANQKKASSEVFIAVAKEQGVYSEKILVKGSLKPTGEVEIRHEIKNYGDVTVTDGVLKIVITSPEGTLAEITNKIDKIDPLEIKAVINKVTLPERAKEGVYTIKSYMTSKNRTFQLEQTFSVEKAPVIVNATEYTALNVGWAKKITVRNLGNDVGSFQAEEVISPFATLFLSGDTAASNEGGKYVWKIEKLKPGKEATISYKVDYMPLVVLAFTVAIVLLFVNRKVRTIRIRKFVMQKKVIKEGAEFTVGVEVKNASGAEATDLLVRDHIPSAFEVKDTYGIKPQKRKTEYGNSMMWTIDKLKDGEERLFSYKIIPIFGISGKISLPSAKVSGKAGGKQMENISGATQIGKPVKQEQTLEDALKKQQKSGGK